MIMRKDVSRQVSKGAAATALLTMLLVLPGLSGQEQAQGKVAKASQAALAGRRIDEQVELRRLGEKGEKLFAAKRYDEAIEVFERALALDPKNGRIHTRLGYMQIVQGDYQRAAKHFEIQAKLGYEPATAVYNLACAASLSGDAQRGLALLQQSVRRGFVNSELMAKDPDLEDLRGLEGFAAALEASRRSADLQAELKTLEAKKDLDGLAQTYRELASIATEDGVLQEQAGLALLRARDCDGALKAFQRQIAVGHQTGRGHYNSACAEALAGRREAALQELELAAKAGMAYDGVQDDPDLASLRGEARFQAVAERLIALQSFQDSIEKSVVSGDLEKARDSLQALLEDGSVTAKTRSWAAYALGRLQLEAKQPEASIASFQRAVTDGYPPGAPAFYIGVAHAGLGNADGALDYFEKALYLGFAEPKELAQALERCGLADGEKGRKLLDFAKKVATDAQKVEQEKKKAAASGWGDAPVLQRKVSGLDTMRRP